MSSTLAVSGLVGQNTGIGVVQKHLYPRLNRRGFQLLMSPSRDYEGGFISRLKALGRGLKGPQGSYSRFLCVTPPLPFRISVPLVTIVHDLRWMRTRSGVSRLYRRIDLARTVKHSSALICVSSRTRDDLVKMFPHAIKKSHVANLGPGIVPQGSFRDAGNGKILLIGDAPHKRNELAADVLHHAMPKWCTGIIGVNLSEAAIDSLNRTFGAENNLYYSRPEESKLVEIYQEAEFFLFLGMEEGFGLPYIEALAAGCKVIAIKQPLTESILGHAASLLQEGDAGFLASQLADRPEIAESVRREHSSTFSWDTFAERVEEVLLQSHEGLAHRSSSV